MGRFLAMAIVVAVGCRSGSGVQDPGPATAAPPPAPTPAPATTGAPAPPVRKRELVQGQGCYGFPEDLPTCRAMGATCRLAPLPEVLPPSPCRNRGARCLEHMMPKPDHDPICSCTCSDEYARAQQAVDAEYARRDEEDRRNRCRQTVDLATGKPVEICSEPELPQ